MNKKKYLYLILISLLLVNCTKQSPATTIVFNPDINIVINNSLNESIQFEVELADTDYKRERGLMYRRSLAENQGMFFDFPNSEIRSFWMKNTYLSLDLLFIDENYFIVDLHEQAFPLREDPILSKVPAKYVFEIKSGMCQKMNIKLGDKVVLQQ